MKDTKTGKIGTIVNQFKSIDSISKKVRRIITTLVATSLVVLGVLSIVLLGYTTVSLLKETLVETARISADRAEWEITSFKNIVTEMGMNEVLAGPNVPLVEKQAVLKDRIEKYHALSGDIVGSDGIGLLDQLDHSDDRYFKQAMSGITYISEPMKINGELQVIVAAPIMSKGSSEITSIVYLSIPHTELNNIVSDIHVAEGGVAYIIDSKGNTVAHSEDNGYVSTHYNVIEEAKTDSSLKGMAEVQTHMIAGNEGFELYFAEGEFRFVAYAPIKNTADGWSIAIRAPLTSYIDVVFLGIFIVVIMVALVVFLSKKVANTFGESIARPIKVCSSRIDMIAKGDLSSEVPEFDSKDEVNILVNATSDIIGELNSIIGDIDYMLHTMAKGDFSVESKDASAYMGSYATILLSLVDIEASLSGTLHLIGDASSQVNHGATQLSQSAYQLTNGALEQTQAVEELNATIDQVQKITVNNANQAKEASEEIHNAVVGTTAGKEAIESLSDAMKAMTAASEEIESIIVDIEGIASETNLLSLNASIEAARAGEAGRGFAIVAQQIASLAEESARSAVNTKELITRSNAEVEKGNRLAEATMKAFNEVINSMQTFDKIASQLNDNSYHQKKFMSEIARAIEQISVVVHDNTAISQETAAISDVLASETEKMDKLIHQFKFKNM